MWILPKQLHTSAFVADTKALGLDSEEFSQICEKSLTWRGKDSLSRTWLQRWNRENWMQHLCSRTLRPSLTESFVDAWISSLGDSRVSHSQLLESVKQQMTQDTSSPTSEMELGTANLELFSSKTWKESSPQKQGTENQFSNMSSESWKAWVTEQRQEYSQRVKSAHLTRESGSSSLELGTNWGTPAANDANKTPHCEVNSNQAGLTRSVGRAEANWPTATVFDTTGGSYPTEMVDGVYRSKHSQEPNSPWYGAKLKDAVETHEQNWRTPDCSDRRSQNSKQQGLSNQVKNWATPNTMDVLPARSPEKLAEAKKKGGCKNLREEVVNWPTATTRDFRDGMNLQKVIRKDGKHRLDSIPRLMQVLTYGYPDQTNPNTNGKNRGSLNPNWVEQLMGMPVGWTDLGSWATESSQLQPPKPS